MKTIRTTILTVGENRDTPRIWIEGMYLENAGFHKGVKISVSVLDDQIIITANDGMKLVSGKKFPVIDINNNSISKVFNVSEKIRVIINQGQIIIHKTKLAIRKSKQLHDGSCASFCSGGGLIDEAAKQAGYNSKWGIEINEKFANVWQQNHKGTMHNLDVAEIPFDELEQVEMLIATPECKPFSKLLRNKKTFHETCDLSMFMLMIIERINPETIVIEQVPQYLKSSIGKVTIQTLEHMGYNVESKLISGINYGSISVRERIVIIASTKQISFPNPQLSNKTLKGILLDPSDPECEWFDRQSKKWLFDYWDHQKQKGNNFVGKQLTEQTKSVPAITSRYFNIQASNPVVKHPTKKGVFRLLTINEVKTIMGLPLDYDLIYPKTIGGNILGQGVLVDVFRKIFEVLKP